MTHGKPEPRWRWIALAVVVLATPLAAGLWWIQRSHTIVYRATGTGCDFTVRHATHDGEQPPVTAHDAWEASAIELAHGDVANLVVSAGRGCEVVRCELEEDGVVVARSEGTAAAICSAWTAR